MVRLADWEQLELVGFHYQLFVIVRSGWLIKGTISRIIRRCGMIKNKELLEIVEKRKKRNIVQ